MGRLSRLQDKLAKRLAKQQEHFRKWHSSLKQGQFHRAAYHHVQFLRQRKAVKKLVGLTRAEKKRIKRNRTRTASGTGPYQGSQSVAMEIASIVERHRGPGKVGSQKRAATDPLSLANPESDHNEANQDAYAIDFLLVNDFKMAETVAIEMGGSWDGDYDSFTVVRGGKVFRIQLIAGTHGTGPHFHSGVKRV